MSKYCECDVPSLRGVLIEGYVQCHVCKKPYKELHHEMEKPKPVNDPYLVGKCMVCESPLNEITNDTHRKLICDNAGCGYQTIKKRDKKKCKCGDPIPMFQKEDECVCGGKI